MKSVWISVDPGYAVWIHLVNLKVVNLLPGQQTEAFVHLGHRFKFAWRDGGVWMKVGDKEAVQLHERSKSHIIKGSTCIRVSLVGHADFW